MQLCKLVVDCTAQQSANLIIRNRQITCTIIMHDNWRLTVKSAGPVLEIFQIYNFVTGLVQHKHSLVTVAWRGWGGMGGEMLTLLVMCSY